MKLFCIYSSIHFNILDDDGVYLDSMGTGEYFIHYVGDDRERSENTHKSRRHYFEGGELEIMVQMLCQGKDLDDTLELHFDTTQNVALMSTLKVQLLGDAFVEALLAYSHCIDDQQHGDIVRKKAEYLRKNRNFEYAPALSPTDWAKIRKRSEGASGESNRSINLEEGQQVLAQLEAEYEQLKNTTDPSINNYINQYLIPIIRSIQYKLKV